MFDKPLPFKFVQRNQNRLGTKKWEFEYIFRFFIGNETSRRKIIVEARQYGSLIFTIDFYAKVAAKEKHVMNLHSSKYRYMTNVGRSNRVAATIFAIIAELRKQHPSMSFGFQAASMLNENGDDNNRRFRAYKLMMGMVTGALNSQWVAFAFEKNSYIFAIQKQQLHKKKHIILEYGNIFGKISEEEDS